MDIAKIGRYIAEKRKRARLTQRQLADKLGRSDKSCQNNTKCYNDSSQKFLFILSFL